MSKRLDNATALYMEGIRDGNYVEAINKYTGAFYKQHSTGVKDGKEGFIEFFGDFVKRCPDRQIEVIRSWEDEDHVFLQVYQNINNGESEWVTTDFFAFDDEDKIIEHWDVISAYSPSTPSGHTTLDGAVEITDEDKTTENVKLVRDLLFNALTPGGDTSKITDLVAEDYIQHNKDIPDGRDAFLKLATNPSRELNYEEPVLCVGQGNFVATLSKANWKDDAIDQDYAQVDIFRVENGLVVEHWDNAEPVPENPVNSGKF